MQLFFCLPPANAFGKLPAHVITLIGIGKRTPDLENGTISGFFRLTRLQQVGLDLVQRLLQLFRTAKQRDCIAITFRHLATVQSLQHCGTVINHCLRQHQQLTKVMIEALGNIACHLDMLNLVTTHRNLFATE